VSADTSRLVSGGPAVAVDEPERGVDVDLAARELIADILARPWGRVSPSVYETGRLVTLAPWLAGHSRRVEFLVSAQLHDGSWGAPDGYALVPTLSATEALLTTLRRMHDRAGTTAAGPVGRASVADAASRGLRMLFGCLHGHPRLPTPDMPAIDLILPTLVELINEHLEWINDSPTADLHAWRGSARLRLPAGIDGVLLAGIRSKLAAGAAVPDKLLHSLEVGGASARGALGVRPVCPGTVGASPAATAAWLGERGHSGPAERAIGYLEAVIGEHGGPVPCGIPVTVFERSWVLSGLAGAGIEVAVPAQLVASLTENIAETGVAGGAGLPPDADTTAVTLLTLDQLGAGREPDCLWVYETATHFCTWQGESNPSTSVNSHVLETFGSWIARRGSEVDRYVAAAERISSWLCDQQEADGRWVDRWHASPFYAVSCCALALHRFGGDQSRLAVRKAVKWILSTQRADGSWGRWRGTMEETAYSMQVLLRTGSAAHDRIPSAVARGHGYLVQSIGRSDHPPLWHDKDLYLPTAIVQAAVLGALHLAQRSIVQS